MSEHALTHYEMTDGALTPGCICGWYSPRRSHSDFERHLHRNTLAPSENTMAAPADPEEDLVPFITRAKGERR